MSWGPIEPDDLTSRRVRLDLKLRAAVRRFNELSVPGVGGVFFVRQLTWAAAGLTVAKETGSHPVRITNAIEALACWIALKFAKDRYSESRRVQGRRKLASIDTCTYTNLSRQTAYVSTPFRRGTTTAFRGLGLSDNETGRFSNIVLNVNGRDLAEAVLGAKGEALRRWITEKWIDRQSDSSQNVPMNVKRALLPGTGTGDDPQGEGPSDAERRLVREALLRNEQRKGLVIALEAMGPDRQHLGTSEGNALLLKRVPDLRQRRTLRAAISFEAMRAAALKAALDCVACVPSPTRFSELADADALRERVAELHALCRTLTDHAESAGICDEEVQRFIREQSKETPVAERIRALAERLPGVLTVSGEKLSRGHLYRDDLVLEDEESGENEIADADVPTPVRLFRLRELAADCGLLPATRR